MTWTAPDDNVGWGVFGQRFDASGGRVGTEFRLNETSDGNQLSDTRSIGGNPTILLEDGTLVSIWSGENEGGAEEVYLRQFELGVSAVGDVTSAFSSASLLSNDTDPDGNILTIAAVDATSANGASVILNGDGTISYDPAGSATIQALKDGETATDSFTYTISDGNGGTDTATVTLIVSGANDAPTSNTLLSNQNADEDAPFSYTLPADAFTDVDGDALTLTAPNLPDWLSFDGTTFTGTPEQADIGSTDITVVATDPLGETASQTFTLSVARVNEAPTATADSYSTGEDTPLTIAAAGVLANDADVDGDALTAVLVSDVANGTLGLNADGSFTYTPDENFNGSASFTYTPNDGTTDGAPVTVDITVNAVNDAPVASSDAFGATLNGESLVNLLTEDEQITPTIARLAGGGFVVSWSSYAPQQGDNSERGVKARLFNDAGLPVSNEFLVNSFTNDDQDVSDVAALTNGGFVIVWKSDDPQQDDLSNLGVKAKIFSCERTRNSR